MYIYLTLSHLCKLVCLKINFNGQTKRHWTISFQILNRSKEMCYATSVPCAGIYCFIFHHSLKLSQLFLSLLAPGYGLVVSFWLVTKNGDNIQYISFHYPLTGALSRTWMVLARVTEISLDGNRLSATFIVLVNLNYLAPLRQAYRQTDAHTHTVHQR